MRQAFNKQNYGSVTDPKEVWIGLDEDAPGTMLDVYIPEFVPVPQNAGKNPSDERVSYKAITESIVIIWPGLVNDKI